MIFISAPKSSSIVQDTTASCILPATCRQICDRCVIQLMRLEVKVTRQINGALN
jgi:hypothetical protein